MFYSVTERAKDTVRGLVFVFLWYLRVRLARIDLILFIFVYLIKIVLLLIVLFLFLLVAIVCYEVCFNEIGVVGLFSRTREWVCGLFCNLESFLKREELSFYFLFIYFENWWPRVFTLLLICLISPMIFTHLLIWGVLGIWYELSAAQSTLGPHLLVKAALSPDLNIFTFEFSIVGVFWYWWKGFFVGRSFIVDELGFWLIGRQCHHPVT